MSCNPDHQEAFHRRDATLHIVKETCYRMINDTLDEAISEALSLDITEEGELSLMAPTLTRERRFTKGGGRRANSVGELGFEPAEEGFNFHLQTGKLLYGARGKCVTSGLEVYTGTVNSKPGANQIEVSGVTLSDAEGYFLEITSGDKSGYKFHIVTHTTDTITTDITVPDSDMVGESFSIQGPPFVHSISEGKTLPSWGLHYEMPNEDEDESIYADLLGVLIKSLEIEIAKGSEGIQSPSFFVAKKVDSAHISDLPDDFPDTDLLKWIHITTAEVTYGSDTPIAKEIADMCRITIENEANAEITLGYQNPNFKKVNSVEYGLAFTYYPQSKLLYELRNTPLEDWTETMNAHIVLTDPNYGIGADDNPYDRVWDFEFNDIYLEDHPVKIPSKEDGIMAVDAVLRLKPPDGIFNAEITDGLGLNHYEGSGAVESGMDD